jgi:hypothetical protein
MSETPKHSDEPTPRTWTAEGAKYYAYAIHKAHVTITTLYRDLVLHLEGTGDVDPEFRTSCMRRIDEETDHLDGLIHEAFGIRTALTQLGGSDRHDHTQTTPEHQLSRGDDS